MGIKGLMKIFEGIKKSIGILHAIIRKKLAVGKERGNAVVMFFHTRPQFGMFRKKGINILACSFRVGQVREVFHVYLPERQRRGSRASRSPSPTRL
jgi:hypothetical protein